MTAIELNPFAHKATMVCTLVLFLKFSCTVLVQGGKRFAGGSRPPEDASLSLAKNFKAKQTFGMGASDNVKHAENDIRWQRIVLNDIENIFIGLIIAWGSLFSPFSSQVHGAAVILFTVGRLMHTFSYAYSLQPHRAIGWFIAVMAMLVMAVNGTIGVMML